MDLFFINLNTIGNAIGWALIHFLWQGVLLFISYWFITRVIVREKIHFHYWLGISFILLCLIIPIREFIIQIGLNHDRGVVQEIGINVGFIKASGILNPVDMFTSIVQKTLPYLVLLWIAIVALISTQLTKSWMTLVKLSKNSTCKVPENLLNKLSSISKQLNLRFEPIISISKKINVPATFGYFKPIVLIPTSLINRLPQDQMEAILLHEMCHIKRADFLHNILQLLVETLFFYHPLTKWISKDVRRVREQCCDELVLNANPNPLVYAKALTNIASIFNDDRDNPSSHIQIAANDGELLNRIKFLMVEKRKKTPISNIVIASIITFFILLTYKNLTVDSTTQPLNNFSVKSVSMNSSSNTLNKPKYLLPNISNMIDQIEIKKNQIIKPKTTQTSTTKSTAIMESNRNIQARSNKLDKPTVIDYNINQSPKLTTPDEILKRNKATVTPKKISTIKPKAFSPKLISKVNPIYKRKFRKIGIEGTVILSFNINSNGRVKNIVVDKSSPMKLLDGSARQALHKWRFDPNSITSNNINYRYQQIFSFTLDKDDVRECIQGNTGSRLNDKKLCN